MDYKGKCLFKVVCDYYKKNEYPVETIESQIYLIIAETEEIASEMAIAQFEHDYPTGDEYLYQTKVMLLGDKQCQKQD